MGQQSAILDDFEEDPDVRVAVRREFDANRLNAILNHPIVRPWVADAANGTLDLGPQVADRNNILLLGLYGGCLFFPIMPGVYEVHSMCLPEGRGAWMKGCVEAVLQWMFTRSNAWEIVTRVPHGHLGARALTIGAGFKVEFTRDDQCLFRGKHVPVDIYRLGIHDWVENSDWARDLGAIFHDQLHAEAARLGITAPAHDDDPQHNKVAGASVEMARNGQVVKAILLYSRWAFLARHSPISLISQDPPVIGMDIGKLHIKPNGIEVVL